MLETLVGLAALAFFFLRPREKEYLWFGIMLLWASDRYLTVYLQFHLFVTKERDLISTLFDRGAALASIAFYRLLRGNRDWFFSA